MPRSQRWWLLGGVWLMVWGLAVATTGVAAAGDPLVAHEWGTFTSLQDELGQELTGINVDDEPVPPFVHRLSDDILSKSLLTSPYWSYRQKGAPRHHPQVTMRLETPVIYFYPPAGTPLPMRLDVSVQFRHGLLTEFYPAARIDSPLAEPDGSEFRFEKFDANTRGQLTWANLQVGTRTPGPVTDWQVWNAPRQVAAAESVTSAEGESEKYIFYRGVGRQRAPLRVNMDRAKHEIEIRAQLAELSTLLPSQTPTTMWLAHVLADGRMAFRSLGNANLTTNQDTILTRASTQFAANEYSTENVDRLKDSMHAALVSDGLFADEATAMLSTWQRAYYTSHGLRLFYLVPRAWTDHYLPLTISAPAQVTRVMVGRIEMISDEQRGLLDKLARTPVANPTWADEIPPSAARDKFYAGRSDFGDLGVTIPPEYQIYMDLGRFRNALIAREEKARGKPTNLTRFINAYGLAPYR